MTASSPSALTVNPSPSIDTDEEETRNASVPPLPPIVREPHWTDSDRHSYELHSRYDQLNDFFVAYIAVAKDLYHASLTAGGFCLDVHEQWAFDSTATTDIAWLFQSPGQKEIRDSWLVEHLLRVDPRWPKEAELLKSILAPHRHFFGVDRPDRRVLLIETLDRAIDWQAAINHGAGIVNLIADNIAAVEGTHRDIVMMDTVRLLEAVENQYEDVVPVDAILIIREVACRLWLRLAEALQQAFPPVTRHSLLTAVQRVGVAHEQLGHAIHDRTEQSALLDEAWSEFIDIEDDGRE